MFCAHFVENIWTNEWMAIMAARGSKFSNTLSQKKKKVHFHKMAMATIGISNCQHSISFVRPNRLLLNAV